MHTVTQKCVEFDWVCMLGGAVIDYHTTPPCLSACVESSFSYPCRKNQKDPSLFSNTICKYPVHFVEILLYAC